MYLALCEDSPRELEALQELLQKWQDARNIRIRCASFSSAVELLTAAQREHFTLYLMDIMMPVMPGHCFSDLLGGICL